jgi:type I restriction enzyme R subunit
VFDCFNGTLMEYFKQATAITAEPPQTSTKTIIQIIDDIWQNRDRAYNIRCLVKRLQRIEKEMSGEARELFAAFVLKGDLAQYANNLPRLLQEDFTGAMALLRHPDFQNLLLHYPRPPRNFLVAYETVDTVTSQWLVRNGAGREYKPGDYLAAFSRFVKENPAQIDAIQILLDRPQDWGTQPLSELRRKLAAATQRFTLDNLQKAHQITYHKALVDIISMVKHAAREEEPLFTAEERVARAFAQVTAGRRFTPEQQQWLDRIRDHLIANLSIEPDDFNNVPVFFNAGGWGKAQRVFPGELDNMIKQFNEALAA